MRLAHFITSLAPERGGVSRIVPSLAAAQERLGWEPRIFTRADGLTASDPPPEAVHLHGLWEAPLAKVAGWALRRGIPLAVSPHGSLDRWSRRRKWLKKRAAWSLYQGRIYRRADLVFVNSGAERAETAEWTGADAPFAVVPNGVDPPPPGAADPEAFRQRWGVPPEAPAMLYFGRLHPKKGALLLPELLERAKELVPEAWLILAGPAAPGVEAKLRAEFERRGLGGRVAFTGLLDGADRWSALAAGDAFILPSSQEGMPMAALEALASGTPVAATPECRLPNIERAGAGRIAEQSPEKFARAVAELLLLDPRAKAKASEAARSLARREHSWDAAAAEMAKAWAWALAKSPDGIFDT